MKKNSLTTAVVAGIAGVAGFAGLANAVYLNPDQVGHVLLYPYYTVDSHQPTLLEVENTTSPDWAVTFPTKHFYIDAPITSAHRVELLDFRIE